MPKGSSSYDRKRNIPSPQTDLTNVVEPDTVDSFISNAL